jgi:hypothetical protein
MQQVMEEAKDGHPIEKDQIKLLSKEEAKQIIKTRDFENFINKTSKIIERALNSTGDVMGSFFEETEDESQKALGLLKGDKITSLFTF